MEGLQTDTFDGGCQKVRMSCGESSRSCTSVSGEDWGSAKMGTERRTLRGGVRSGVAIVLEKSFDEVCISTFLVPDERDRDDLEGLDLPADLVS